MTTSFERPEAVIFDMDGTLFETATLLATVHERLFRTLREEGLYDQTPPLDDLLGCLGIFAGRYLAQADAGQFRRSPPAGR